MAGNKSVKVINKVGAWGGAYFLTVIGSAVLWAQLSSGFGEFVVTMLKSYVWPAFAMHRVISTAWYVVMLYPTVLIDWYI